LRSTSLPAFRHAEFGMAADSAQVGWVITGFFLGLAVGGCTGRSPIPGSLYAIVHRIGLGRRSAIVARRSVDRGGPLAWGLPAAPGRSAWRCCAILRAGDGPLMSMIGVPARADPQVPAPV
jgi:hypothetical protein